MDIKEIEVEFTARVSIPVTSNDPMNSVIEVNEFMRRVLRPHLDDLTPIKTFELTDIQPLYAKPEVVQITKNIALKAV